MLVVALALVVAPLAGCGSGKKLSDNSACDDFVHATLSEHGWKQSAAVSYLHASGMKGDEISLFDPANGRGELVYEICLGGQVDALGDATEQVLSTADVHDAISQYQAESVLGG